MIKAPTIPTMTDPKLLDWVLLEFQTKLSSSLSWLDHAFGKAQKFQKDGLTYPAVYIGANDYLNVLPDSHIGCYSFFDIDDGQKINHMPSRVQDYEVTGALIFWFDLRDIYPTDSNLRTIENVKSDIIDAINTSRLTRCQFELLNVYEEASNVFRNYTHKEIKTQFRMYPYSALKFTFRIKYKPNQC